MARSRPFRTLRLGLIAASLLFACTRPPVAAVAPQAVWLLGGTVPVVPAGWRVETLLPDLHRVVVPLAEAVLAEAYLKGLAGTRFVEANRHYALTRPVSIAQISRPDPLPGFSTRPAAPMAWNLLLAGVDKAWTLTSGNRDLKVAVIDSGVDPHHPDLQDHLLPLVDVWVETEGSDTLHTTTGDFDYDGRDGNGHGTHVAGILAATLDTESGVSGVAPGVTVLPIKATDYEGNTSAFTLSRAIKRAVDEGCRVINISIGGPPDAVEGRALAQTVAFAISKGVVIVAATGNESNRRIGEVAPVAIPAAYPGVIAVSAITDKELIANYSNGGPETVITAPGGGGNRREGAKIRSTWPTYATFEGMKAHIDGPYAELAGTSMACPHVAGAVALLLSREPTLTPAQVRVRLAATAIDVGPVGFDTASGYGRLRVDAALHAAGPGG
ncbi:MAG: S8 family serine peptidase [Candidatus Sericytochromatia bacterium]|nr:S8 family serine peptidase [Candidatus Sericytochromatia bacterium]